MTDSDINYKVEKKMAVKSKSAKMIRKIDDTTADVVDLPTPSAPP